MTSKTINWVATGLVVAVLGLILWDSSATHVYPTSIEYQSNHGVERSRDWPRARHEHLVANPACEACGATKNLQVHHVLPFHLYPELELEQSNLITLCGEPRMCHYRYGHLFDWKAYNPDVREHAAESMEQIKNRRYER